MDFGVSTSGFEARLCHLIFYLFAIECCYSTLFLASATHPTLLWAPIFHQQEDQDNGFTFFNAGGLRFVNRHGGTLRRAGWVALTKTYSWGKWLISLLPASLYLTSPRSRPTHPRVPYLMCSSSSSRVPKFQVPTHASRCPCRPLVLSCSNPPWLVRTARHQWSSHSWCTVHVQDKMFCVKRTGSFERAVRIGS